MKYAYNIAVQHGPFQNNCWFYITCVGVNVCMCECVVYVLCMWQRKYVFKCTVCVRKFVYVACM